MKRYIVAVLALMMVIGTAVPVSAASKLKIEEVQYEGKGKVEVDFYGKVKWKTPKVTVKDSAGKKYSAKVLKKDSDDITFRINKYTPGEKYKFTISGVKKRGAKKFTKVNGTVRIPAANNRPAPVKPDPAPVNPDPAPVNPDPAPVTPDPAPADQQPAPADNAGQYTVTVKDVDFDWDDQEIEIEFYERVKWNQPTVTITDQAGNNYVLWIIEKDDDGIEVKTQNVQQGGVYSYEITGVSNRSGGESQTVTGEFTAYDD